MLKNLIEDQGRSALMASIGNTTTKAGASASVLGWLVSQEGLAFVGVGVAIIGLGFSGGNAVMLYAGFANTFQPLAQAFGAWEADIWAQANQYSAQVKAGDAPMLTPTQAVERVPSFEFTGA